MDEREFELVNIIGAEISASQRDLSRHMDLSLGMVNMLIRRLVSKGYIRINQLNKRKVEYILTPKGFSEKMRKSFRYMLKTINSMGAIKDRLNEVLTPVVESGQREFTILGESDFSILVEMVIREICPDECTVVHVQSLTKNNAVGTILICREEFESEEPLTPENSVDLVTALAKDYTIPRFEEATQS